MASDVAHIGLIGLGVMGRGLALNLAEHGARVAAHDRDPQAIVRLTANASGAIDGFASPAALVGALATPRTIMLLLPAGHPVDDALAALAPSLSAGDVVIDGGNSHYRDTIRRAQELRAHGVELLGLGISGGESGARHGPALMAGGTEEAWRQVGNLFLAIAARGADGAPACGFFGGDGAGHFVKMVHNGIEYAQMQSIAEIVELLRHRQMSHAAVADTLDGWNEGVLESYLLQVTIDLLRRRDPLTARPALDVIADTAGQKGTGAWAAIAALELGTAAPTIAEAVFARAVSVHRDIRATASAARSTVTSRIGDTAEHDLADALAGTMVSIYAQGLELLAAGRAQHGWRFALRLLADAWQAGCIVRARLLSELAREADGSPHILLAPRARAALETAEPGWRRVVASAASMATATPALSSALAYVDAMRSNRLWTATIQGQRDSFGAHGFARIDRPGRFHLDGSRADGGEA